MATTLSFFSLFTLTLILAHFSITNGTFSEKSNIMLHTNQQNTEKTTHLHFFYHENLEGKNPTVIKIIDPSTNSPTGFGATFMMDNLLTLQQELTSKPIGRAQGIFGSASLNDRGLVMLINLVFIEGEFAGSTLSLLGRNPVQDTVREMPIVGGTGVFRFARGFAVVKSLYEISTSENFVVEYNVTVSHP
ncbi:dirigent protein 21-like [Vicia villosa]|uniref:dirigent protein 21-like n=1 Tax=Vicia villosa TaxID=3911 RepID=UPI00273AD9C7|nr:dirigent protein 21-like [Vicia villosa]